MRAHPRPPRPHRPTSGPPVGAGVTASPFETLAWIVLAIMFTVGLVVWATGQLTARVTSGVWLAVSPADMGAVMVRLLGDTADPAGAWPPDAAAQIPGPVVFWSVAGLLASVPVAGVVAVVRWRARRRGDEPAAARWANRRDLRALTVHKPTSGRVTLGRAGRRLLAAEARQSVIVIGPSQSGKTTGLAIPAILEWDGPVIATSVKSDLLADTIAARQSRGTVWAYDPTATAGLGVASATWTPLAACESWQGAQRVAAWLTDAGREGGLQEADFWYATAAKLLAPLLFAAANADLTMADVVRWVDTQEEREVRFELEAVGLIEALQSAEATWNREERQRSSVYTTAEMVLRCFADPAVARSADGCDITAEQLLDGGAHTLYVCAPSHEQARLYPLFTALLQQLLTAAYEHAASGALLQRPLLIVLDEAANIAPLRNLDTIASTAAGVGIQLVTVWQDMAQIHNRYGDRAATVVNNHRAKLALSGISDPRTLEYFSRLVGDAEITRASNTHDGSGKVSTTEGTQYRRLTSDDALRQMGHRMGLLVYGCIPSVRIHLRASYSNDMLRIRQRTTNTSRRKD